MRIFSKRTFIYLICAMSIGCVMTLNDPAAMADKHVDVSVIKADAQGINDAVATEGFLLQLSAKPTATSSGSVMCHVTLKNTTNHPLYFPLSYPPADYRFLVMDEAGKVVPLTQFSKDHDFGGGGFMNIKGHIDPNQSISFNFPVKRLYDMSNSGVYTVHVIRKILQKDGDRFEEATITSNSIWISRKTTVINNVTIQSKSGESIPKNQAVGESEIKWSPIINGIQLGISSDDTLTRGGDQMRLHIALRNTLDQPVAMPPLFLGQNLHVKMIGAERVPVSLTELGKMVTAASMSLFSAKTIPPHSVLSGDVSVDKIYDLSRAGAYSISATAGNSLQDVQPLETPPLTIQVKNNDFNKSINQ